MKELLLLARKGLSCIFTKLKMASETLASKRPLDPSLASALPSKIQKTQTDGDVTSQRQYHRKKMALLMMFSGKGYYGMQNNPGYRTIESDLYKALLDSGHITQENFENLKKQTGFQRATRTDKGVSAAGMVVSLKMFANIDDGMKKLNNSLPPQIRALEAIQTTKGFDAKNRADARSYSYTIPTFAFTQHDQPLNEDYRISDETLSKVSDLLRKFCGSRNFYNYTSGRLVTDASCRRYIIQFYTGKPFVKEGLEFVVIYIKGQSFMLHQIRKMIGMCVSLVQGLVKEDYFDKTFGPERVDVPKVPGVGLMLEEVHFSNYNEKFGHDGIHRSITFQPHKERIELFKHEFIYPDMAQAEVKDKSMLEWLEMLRERHFMSEKQTEQQDQQQQQQQLSQPPASCSNDTTTTTENNTQNTGANTTTTTESTKCDEKEHLIESDSEKAKSSLLTDDKTQDVEMTSNKKVEGSLIHEEKKVEGLQS